MTRLQITTALGAALFVVSCKPISDTLPEQDTLTAESTGQENGGSQPPPERPRDAWLRGSGYPVESEGFEPQPQLQQQAEAKPARYRHPVAERTDKIDRVISPYPPYNVIDVEGFKSGQLAKDPSNGKIFRIP